MVLSVRRWLRRIWFALLLVLFTLVMYTGCRIAAVWIAPSDPYRVPQGNAVKVFGQNVPEDAGMTFIERLRLFYWYGE